MAGTHNPLLPEMATVIETVQETHNIKTFRVRFDDEEKMKNFTFQPGQVGQLSVFGVGESTFVINSSPTRMDYLQFSVMKAGENTAALHKLNAGDKIGVRAPLGNWFPYEQWKGKNVFFIGGGIGIFVAYVGMLNVNLVTFTPKDTKAAGKGLATGATPGLATLNTPTLWLFLIGLALTIVLLVCKVKGAILIGIVVTTLIGIPMKGGAMDGLDALLATVQMPSGIPVATVALNGAKNAAVLAAQILAVSDDTLAAKLDAARADMAAQIEAKEAKLQAELG